MYTITLKGGLEIRDVSKSVVSLIEEAVSDQYSFVLTTYMMIRVSEIVCVLKDTGYKATCNK